MKDFIKVRRTQIKEVKNGGTVTDKFSALILSQSSQ